MINDYLDVSARAWLAKAMVGVMLSDGHLHDKELEAFKSTVGDLVDTQTLQQLAEHLENRSMPTLPPIEIDPNERFEMLKELTQMAANDDKLTHEEEEYLQLCGKMLKIPEETIDLLVEQTRKGLTATLEVRLRHGRMKNEVVGMAWTRTSCTVFADYPLEVGSEVTLEVKFPLDLPPDEYFEPISARITQVKKSQESKGRYLYELEFQERLHLQHGVIHHLNPERYEKRRAEKLEAPHPGFRGFKGMCRICGSREVLVFRPKVELVRVRNLFGVQTFRQDASVQGAIPASGYLPKVCPRCLYASDTEGFVYVPGSKVKPERLFSDKFRNNWLTTIGERRRRVNIESAQHWDVFKRNQDQALQAWKFANDGALFQAGVLTGEDAVLQKIRAVLSRMHMAELELMRKQKNQAVEHQRQALELLSELREQSSGSRKAKLLALSAMTALYIEDLSEYKTLLGALQRMDVEEEQRQSWERIVDAMLEVDANKHAYQWKQLSHYARAEPYLGLSDLGSDIDYLATE